MTLLLKSKAVFTGLANEPHAATIVVNGQKIEAVLPYDAEIEGARTIDVGERLITPGLHDAHLHLMFGSMYEHASVNLDQAKNAREAIEILKAFSDKNPDDEWIIGYGWDQTNWDVNEFPHRSDIDAFITDRPVILFHAEGHYTWLNTKGLEVANITKDTVAPPFGEIEKDENGELTGILIETASNLASEYALDFPHERRLELFDQFLKLAARLGITSVNDLFASFFEKLNNFSIYGEFEQRGQLTTRIHLYPQLEEDLTRARQLREQFNSDKLQLAGLKEFIDGVVTGHTALMIDPYVDRPETRGEPTKSKEQFQQLVTQADAEGFQIRFHTIGDGAVRFGLDLFEEAQKQNGTRDSRHALEHIEVVSPTDIPRFRQLGVIPSVQPSHLALMPRESHTTRVTEEKYPYIYNIKTLQDSVDHIAFSTDFPITPLDPMKELYYAITRNDFNGEPWNGKEAVSLADALRGYTLGAAYSTHREQELGTIEPGKFADFAIFESNLFDLTPEQVKEATVSMTIMDGNVIYDRNDLV